MNLDPYFIQAMQDLQVPALSVAVIKDDQVVFARGYGQREPGGLPADEHTTYAIASISKSFTATALGMLVDEGCVRWDARVSDYLPGFALLDPFASREMRVRDLLLHNSGIHEVSGGTIWYGSDLSREEVVRRLRYLRPTYSFRSHYDYQNVMYLAAGQIIPAVTGLSWDEFVQTRILNPLGMKDSAPNWAVGRTNFNKAAPFARLPYGSGSSTITQVPYRDHDNVGPAASLHASAWDLAQYLRLHMGDGTFEGQTLLTPGTINELHTGQIAVQNGGSTVSARLKPRFLTYALGWRIFDYAGYRTVQHSGGVDGMRTLVTMFPEERLGIVALCNQEAPLSHAATYRMADELLGLDTIDYGAAYRLSVEQSRAGEQAFFIQVEAARMTGTHPSLPLEAYVGRYLSALVDYIEVLYEDGRLVLRFAHSPNFTADLSHWHHNTFRLDWRDPYMPWGLVTFQLGAHGRVDALNLSQPNLLDVDFRELGILPKEN